ncbi:hypothetical protein BPOR_0017g00270 [Botrytis porri]|uniref:Uncharacterized protein n=1 Tax=Botrytis porri TaxID=87229 RepID=A0A4Z1L4V0_9HELO|nr:hypothetical protein BPOR_0017g00270 [Botrytis porri]
MDTPIHMETHGSLAERLIAMFGSNGDNEAISKAASTHISFLYSSEIKQEYRGVAELCIQIQEAVPR